jgi:hypothetical protein
MVMLAGFLTAGAAALALAGAALEAAALGAALGAAELAAALGAALEAAGLVPVLPELPQANKENTIISAKSMQRTIFAFFIFTLLYFLDLWLLPSSPADG